MAAPPQGCPMHQEAQPAKGEPMFYHAVLYHVILSMDAKMT